MILHLEAFSVNDGWTTFVVFLFGNPHLLECWKGSQDGASDPHRVFTFWWRNDLDLHRGRSKSGDFLLHTIRNTCSGHSILKCVVSPAGNLCGQTNTLMYLFRPGVRNRRPVKPFSVVIANTDFSHWFIPYMKKINFSCGPARCLKLVIWPTDKWCTPLL